MPSSVTNSVTQSVAISETSARLALIIGCLLAAAGVALAAIAAHAAPRGAGGAVLDPAAAARLSASLANAAQMLMLHGPAVITVSLWQQARPSRLRAAGLMLIAVGPAVFAASIAVHAAGLTAHAPLAPAGGSATILGWLILALSAWRRA